MTAQKSQKGRKTNFKSRRRGRRAATPARLLPALRQTARPGCGVSPCFQEVGHGQTARRSPGAVLLPWCRRGRSAPLCGAVRAYKHIDIKEPRQAVNLFGVSCVITNASGGGCGASSSLQAVAPLRGCTWVYCKAASLPGSYNSPVHSGAEFRTLEALKYFGCLVCCGF